MAKAVHVAKSKANVKKNYLKMWKPLWDMGVNTVTVYTVAFREGL